MLGLSQIANQALEYTWADTYSNVYAFSLRFGIHGYYFKENDWYAVSNAQNQVA